MRAFTLPSGNFGSGWGNVFQLLLFLLSYTTNLIALALAVLQRAAPVGVAKPPPPRIRYSNVMKNGESTILYYGKPDGRSELGVLFLS